MSSKVYFGQDNIKPDFLRQDEDETVTIYRNNLAKNELKKLEQSAESDTFDDQYQNSSSTAKSREKSFSYTGKGKSLADSIRAAKKSKIGKGMRFKKQLPLFGIAGAIVAALFFMFLSVGSLGNQIETLITRATDTMFGSYSENTIRVTEELLAGKRGEFPEYFEERLNDNGIQVEGGEGGYTLDWGGIKVTSGTFRDTYQNDVNFREAYTKAKRGRTSNFFDLSAAFAFTRLGVTRNLYRNYKQTGDNDVDTKSYKKVESDLFDGGTNAAMNTVTDRQKVDEDGNPIVDENGNPVTERVKTGEDVGNSQGGDSRVKAKGYLASIAGRVADTTSIACATLKVANMISVSIAAAEIYQAINYFLSNAENISKTKAGDGNNAAENQLLNFLNEPKEATYVDVETGEEKSVTGAPIQAEGFANTLAGTTPDLKKTRNYSVESAFTATGFAIGLSALNNKACGGLRAVGAAASIAVGLFGGGLVKSLVTLAKTTFINMALQASISAALAFLVPKIAQALFENTADSLAGIPAGETFVKGAALSNKKVARSTSGQMLADKETATAYAHQTQIANAMESELQRKDASPFDASNPDTFLGSIMSKFAIIKSRNSLISTMSSVSSVAGNSLSSLVGKIGNKTFANSITDPQYEVDTELAGTDYSDILAEDETCANLTSIGAACDMYGADITATNPDVMKVSSDDPKYLEIVKKNARKKEDGTWEVIPNSLLANKIMFCDERDSPFGVWDSNIANAFNISLGFGDSIPILNDVIDLVNALEDLDPETDGWARGSFCVMNKSTNPHYEELIYLQHFTEDMRIATQIELDEVTGEDGKAKSPTIAYKEDYYEKNPIDTSEAGIIARLTGKPKAEAEEMIALIDYYNYLSNYNPPAEEKPEYHLILEEDELNQTATIILNKFEFYDLRNRNFAA